MSKARKTIDIVELTSIANRMLANSADELVSERQGIAALLESALHHANAYKGFGYLQITWNADHTLSFGDESRRVYYLA